MDVKPSSDACKVQDHYTNLAENWLTSVGRNGWQVLVTVTPVSDVPGDTGAKLDGKVRLVEAAQRLEVTVIVEDNSDGVAPYKTTLLQWLEESYSSHTQVCNVDKLLAIS